MRQKRITAIFAVTLLLSGCATPEPTQTPPFPEWKTNLDQPIGQLETTLATLDRQQSMNYTVSNIAFLYDAKLRILFDDFLASLPPSERNAQIAQQREWLKQRKVQILRIYTKAGGSMAAYEAGQAFINTTKKRIADIERKMGKEPKGTR